MCRENSAPTAKFLLLLLCVISHIGLLMQSHFGHIDLFLESNVTVNELELTINCIYSIRLWFYIFFVNTSIPTISESFQCPYLIHYASDNYNTLLTLLLSQTTFHCHIYSMSDKVDAILK